jgi:uncharacterized protein (TIGR00290 family)
MSARLCTPTALSWSGGKDSALALHALLMDPTVDVRGLLTTVTDSYDRVSMHGVRTALVTAQAEALGIPLWTVRIPPSATNEQYERAMLDGFEALVRLGVEAIAFGDLFLEDVRAYRERLVARSQLRPMFPLWGKSTNLLAEGFSRSGFKAVLVCVDPRQIDVSHCGSEFDSELLAALPSTADPCGENGEFHTFVYDGPMFCQPIATQRGVVVEREGFVFCDLLPRDAAGATSL